MKAIDLRTGHLKNPLGVDFQNPHLSWIPSGSLHQTAYRVRGFCQEEQIFDTGKVFSQQTYCDMDITLPSRSRVTWSVVLWDEEDCEGEPAEGWFEKGLDKDEWKAVWINPESDLKKEEDKEQRHPASYLKKMFMVQKMDGVICARLYITAHGIYDVYLNGNHIDTYLLAPGNSQYSKRLQVQTYDIGEFLCQGNNEILVTLGDGWYRGCTHNDMNTNAFGTDTALLCQIEVNGMPAAVSDDSWIASQNGPLGLNDLMMGEAYDARRLPITEWHKVTEMEYGFDNLVGTDTVPVTAHEKFQASLIVTPAGETVLDFGQNMAGFVQFELRAHAGQKLILTHGEVLDPNGNFTIQNFQNPRHPYCCQKIDYTCREGINSYCPTKSYFGFRYVKVEGDVQVTGEEFTAVSIYSDMEQTGYFECGDERVNRLVQNALWSMKSNFVDVPTDCPTREKSGYSGDLVTFCHTAMYLMDCRAVLLRWLAEQAATQFEDGCVHQVAPDGRERGLWDGGAGWCDSMEIIPWQMMKRYHDISLARRQYDSAKRWMMFCLERAKNTREENHDVPADLQPYFADQGMHWGEWLEPDTDVMQYMTNIGMHGEPEVATAYLSYGCMAMSEMASALGEKEDAVFFASASDKARTAYRSKFVPEGHIKDTKRQCCYVRPLAMGLLDEGEKQKAAERLAQNVREHDNHLNTGFLSTHELCRVLTDNGYCKTAYDLLLQEEYPGWLYPVIKGATTIWENWQGIAKDGSVRDSMNHYSFGSIVGWLFDRVCGIIVENGEIIIRPYPDPRLGYAKAVYLSPLGKIESSWIYKEHKIQFEFLVPGNCTARVFLPNKEEYTVEAGKYIYTINDKI